MTKAVDFSLYFEDDPDIDPMSREELLARLEMLKERLSTLDRQEPRSVNSEAYEDWGEAHELVEDQIDEILDRLEDMK